MAPFFSKLPELVVFWGNNEMLDLKGKGHPKLTAVKEKRPYLACHMNVARQ